MNYCASINQSCIWDNNSNWYFYFLRIFQISIWYGIYILLCLCLWTKLLVQVLGHTKVDFSHFDFISRMQVHDSWEDNLSIVYLNNSSSLHLLVLPLSQLPLFLTRIFQVNLSKEVLCCWLISTTYWHYQFCLLSAICKCYKD